MVEYRGYILADLGGGVRVQMGASGARVHQMIIQQWNAATTTRHS